MRKRRPSEIFGSALIDAVMAYNWLVELRYNAKSFLAMNRMIGKRNMPLPHKTMEIYPSEVLDLVEAVETNLASKIGKYVQI